jgi:tRNA dimethylallyltransferase
VNNPLIAIVGPTATGKSALGIAVARAVGGEIVACDSTAVYRGLDIGTDKVAAADQQGIPHHLVDMVAIDQVYSAAEYARDAAREIRAIGARGRIPVLVGGTGFYYRALTRGLFPGPSRDDELRARLDRIASRRGVERLWGWLGRVDRESALRIMPRDQKRIVRALEVYLLTRRPLSEHFAETVSPIADFSVLTIGVDLDRTLLLSRVARRVDEQLARGVVAEVERLLAAGVSREAHAFSGLVYRQVVEYLGGTRDLSATRELIVRANMQYARRQKLWFRKEPRVVWFDGPGERASTSAEAVGCVRAFLENPNAAHVRERLSIGEP